MSSPSVWIIVLQWNGWKDTRLCLESLAARTFAGARVVVVDNGSTDGSLEELRRAEGVRVIETGRNLRFAGGNNVALREAMREGVDFAMLLNNDTLVEPGFLEPLLDFMARNPRAGAVSPLIHYAEPPDRIWFAGGGVNFWLGLTWHAGLRRTDRGQFLEPARCGYLTGCALLVRGAVLRQVGLLDEDYFIYTEDADFTQRIRRAGHELWCVPASRIRHRISASSGGGSTPFKLYHRTVSNLKFFARYARPWQWLTWPVAFLGAQLAYGVLALARGRADLAAAVLRGLWDGVRGEEARA